MTHITTQSNPNVVLKIIDFDLSQSERGASDAYINPYVAAAYANGAVTVKVIDMNNVQIGSFPRTNPNA